MQLCEGVSRARPISTTRNATRPIYSVLIRPTRQSATTRDGRHSKSLVSGFRPRNTSFSIDLLVSVWIWHRPRGQNIGHGINRRFGLNLKHLALLASFNITDSTTSTTTSSLLLLQACLYVLYSTSGAVRSHGDMVQWCKSHHVNDFCIRS